MIERNEYGKIEKIEVYQSLISNKSLIKIDFSKPIIIVYYPGKDPCNSGGHATKESLKNWFSTLEKGVLQLNANSPIYLYKDKDGLEKYEGIIKWFKDPEGLTEKLFFEHHYPCSSFVVISPNGEYVSFFGEFSKEYVWRIINTVSK
ncbi:hypothetical protein [Gillisia sp. Hel_I_86]|uniref:hypothetical protein n=1 Tax=Gillisia sp. Hel_I_86 TaxID=1249981 RepID=UPI0011A2C4E5|nr:hypothetical protein [Gillisia sp. Hel_I_86]